jgi:Ion transport protein
MIKQPPCCSLKKRPCLLIYLILIASRSNAFTTTIPHRVRESRLRWDAGPSVAPVILAAINGDLTPEINQENSEVNGVSTKGDAAINTTVSGMNQPSQQSVLYSDGASQVKEEQKATVSVDPKIGVYHNILLKNANDCSVCTVPDKIDPSKIVAPKKDQPNGVTPTQTLKRSVQEIKKQVNVFIQQPSVELADVLLILASSFFVALTTVSTLPPTVMSTVYFLQDATLVMFAFGFVSRWWSSLQPRGTYFDDPLEWVDLAVVVLPFMFLAIPSLALVMPSWLTSQTSLINLRLLRVLRFQRLLQDELSFSRFVSGLWIPPGSGKDALSCVIVESWQLQLARVLLSLFTLISISTGLIYAAEQGVNPGIENYFSALYCKCVGWGFLMLARPISFSPCITLLFSIFT